MAMFPTVAEFQVMIDELEINKQRAMAMAAIELQRSPYQLSSIYQQMIKVGCGLNDHQNTLRDLQDRAKWIEK